MAKRHRTSYLPSLNKSLESIVVIHSDVRGSAKISSLSSLLRISQNGRYLIAEADSFTLI